MRIYALIILSVFILLIPLSLFLLVYPDENEISPVIESEITWEIKKKESRSRLSSVPILLYHDIDGKGIYSLPLETLRSHFQYIKDNNIKVIKLSELIERLSEPAPFSEKVLAISFDDGFLSMYTRLLPLVKEFGFPISLFVYTNNVFTKAENNITWAQLREMEEYGIEVECHSMSHIDIDEISAENSGYIKRKLFKEIYLSKRIIELYMDKTVNYFAFPYGRYNLKLIEMCRLADYKRVFSTEYRKHIITRDNYCLGRGHIKKNYSLSLIEQFIQ